MASRAFRSILSLANARERPGVQKWVWQRVYNTLSRFSRNRQDWVFMNYGYVAPDAEPFPLDPKDEADRAHIGLYHQAVEGLDLSGKRVLEVGCGRGGGCSFIMRYYKPSEVVGLDYSLQTVKVAELLHKDVKHVSFQAGDAEHLPFDDNSFDIIINIESSHCYGDVSAFFKEVARVLKPGGTFTWADLGSAGMIENLNTAIGTAPLALLGETELTAGVAVSLDETSDRKQAQIGKRLMFGRFLNEFAATKDTTIYKGIKSGAIRYLARRYTIN